jgi:hypothetical protein
MTSTHPEITAMLRACHAIAEQLTDLDGVAWRAEIPKRDHVYWCELFSTKPDERLRVEQDADPHRYAISTIHLKAPPGYGCMVIIPSEYRTRELGDPARSITCSATRSAASIAGDIRRRLLPGSRTFWTWEREELERYADQTNAQNAAKARLIGAGGGMVEEHYYPRADRLDLAEYYATGNHGIGGEVEHVGRDTADFRITRVPLHVAEKMLAVLSEYAHRKPGD